MSEGLGSMPLAGTIPRSLNFNLQTIPALNIAKTQSDTEPSPSLSPSALRSGQLNASSFSYHSSCRSEGAGSRDLTREQMSRCLLKLVVVFDAAQNCIFELMFADSYYRFLSSDFAVHVPHTASCAQHTHSNTHSSISSNNTSGSSSSSSYNSNHSHNGNNMGSKTRSQRLLQQV